AARSVGTHLTPCDVGGIRKDHRDRGPLTMKQLPARVEELVSRVVLALALAIAAIPCEAAQAQSPPTEAGAEYLIGPEDVLDVAVWNNTEITRTVPVRPDGQISLPLLNDVQPARLPPLPLRDLLGQGLDSHTRSPTVVGTGR